VYLFALPRINRMPGQGSFLSSFGTMKHKTDAKSPQVNR
jgi:hypothetical protein